MSTYIGYVINAVKGVLDLADAIVRLSTVRGTLFLSPYIGTPTVDAFYYPPNRMLLASFPEMNMVNVKPVNTLLKEIENRINVGTFMGEYEALLQYVAKASTSPLFPTVAQSRNRSCTIQNAVNGKCGLPIAGALVEDHLAGFYLRVHVSAKAMTNGSNYACVWCRGYESVFNKTTHEFGLDNEIKDVALPILVLETALAGATITANTLCPWCGLVVLNRAMGLIVNIAHEYPREVKKYVLSTSAINGVTPPNMAVSIRRVKENVTTLLSSSTLSFLLSEEEKDGVRKILANSEALVTSIASFF